MGSNVEGTGTVPEDSGDNKEQQQPRILVVDDEPLALEIAQMTLDRQGFRTMSARGGIPGLEMIRSERPDLVLLDITMPDLDGFGVFKELRNDPELVNLPVIFVTARDDMADKVHGLELGAVDYITKPYNPSELIARVRSTLRMKKLEREAAGREREEARRKVVETLLVTLAHYINNALAAISGRVAITNSSDQQSVEKMMDVVKRRTRVIAATIECIEEIQDDLESYTTQYASSEVDILNLEEKIQERVDRLAERDQEMGQFEDTPPQES